MSQMGRRIFPPAALRFFAGVLGLLTLFAVCVGEGELLSQRAF